MNNSSKFTSSLTAVAVLSWCAAQQIKDVNNVQEVEIFTDHITESVNDTLYKKNISTPLQLSQAINIDLWDNKSERFVWKKELKYFVNYFWLENQNQFETTVKEIQSRASLKQDGVLWPNTLKEVYVHHYAKEDRNNLPHDIVARLEVYEEMEWYKTHPWKPSKFGRLFPTKVPDIFSKNYFYGIGKTENIEWTYINPKAASILFKEIEPKYPLAVLVHVKHEGIDDYIIGAYVDWKLQLATYTSPGDPSLSWWVRTRIWNYKTRIDNMYYISSARDSVFKTSEWMKWAIMPYALHVTWWIYAHAWFVDGDRKSHGCIRMPIYYAKWLYDLYKDHGSLKWEIQNN